jgi:glycosyltransferase involved in cell wall biosynthesis
MRIFVPSAAEVLTDHRGHGEGLIAWQLLSRLAQRGHAIVACAREVDIRGDAPFEAVELGRGPLESLEPLRIGRRARAVFAAHGAFDLVHWIFPPDFDEIRSPSADVPFVYGPHSLSWPENGARRGFRPGDLARGAVRPMLRRSSGGALASASLLLHSTPQAAAELPRGPHRLLPFGVDAALFSPTSPPEVRSVLVVGSLEPVKHVDVVIRALALLPEDVTLTIAGSGSEEAKLRELAAAHGVERRVSWLGDVDHARVPELMHEASVVCSAAVGEPFGMTILEAMASARPVVAVDRGGPAFLVERDGGSLVQPGDDAGLAAALARVLDDRGLMESMGAHNRARVERELTWDRVLDRLEQLYEEARCAS